MPITFDSRNIRLFDYTTEFAAPFREAIRGRSTKASLEAVGYVLSGRDRATIPPLTCPSFLGSP